MARAFSLIIFLKRLTTLFYTYVLGSKDSILMPCTKHHLLILVLIKKILLLNLITLIVTLNCTFINCIKLLGNLIINYTRRLSLKYRSYIRLKNRLVISI